MKEEKIFQPVPSRGIFLAYELLLKDNLVSFPLTQEGRNKVESLVANINNPHFGKWLYKTAEEKSVAYMYFIIKDHPFTDGNKRTATLVFEISCELNELTPDYSEFSLDTVAVFIEKIQTLDHQTFIQDLSSLLFPLAE